MVLQEARASAAECRALREEALAEPSGELQRIGASKLPRLLSRIRHEEKHQRVQIFFKCWVGEACDRYIIWFKRMLVSGKHGFENEDHVT